MVEIDKMYKYVGPSDALIKYGTGVKVLGLPNDTCASVRMLGKNRLPGEEPLCLNREYLMPFGGDGSADCRS
jgi:hypothetical protein